MDQKSKKSSQSGLSGDDMHRKSRVAFQEEVEENEITQHSFHVPKRSSSILSRTSSKAGSKKGLKKLVKTGSRTTSRKASKSTMGDYYPLQYSKRESKTSFRGDREGMASVAPSRVSQKEQRPPQQSKKTSIRTVAQSLGIELGSLIDSCGFFDLRDGYINSDLRTERIVLKIYYKDQLSPQRLKEITLFHMERVKHVKF